MVRVSSPHLLLHHILWFCSKNLFPLSKEGALYVVAESWAFNFLVTKIVVPTSTQYDITNITFEAVQFTFKSVAYECVCISVFCSTIIWCIQRFLFVGIDMSFTEMLSKKRKEKVNDILYSTEYDITSAIMICTTPTSCRWIFSSSIFLWYISSFYARHLKNWAKKKTYVSRRQHILHSEDDMSGCLTASYILLRFCLDKQTHKPFPSMCL